MKILDRFPRIKALLVAPPPTPPPLQGEGYESRDYKAFHNGYSPLFSVSYTGEKNEGAMGPVKRYWLDYIALRARSWASYLDSEITQGILNKFAGWIVGSGLKLQSEPVVRALATEGITLNDKESFSKDIEARFRMFARSKKTDHGGRENLSQLAQTAYLNAIVGGDMLVVLRLIKGNITVQIIDGSQVQQPLFTSEFVTAANKNGNTISHGVERDKTGKHVAYYVRKSFNDFTVIKAETAGRLTAFLVYGQRYRIDNTRGIPIISAVMESIAKIDRYREAMVDSAEERAKVVYSVEHGSISTGENPHIDGMKAAFNADAKEQTGPIDGEAVAAKVATTTKKQVVNMPRGATLKALDSKTELHYEVFYNVNINSIASAVGIPPEVALSKYDSNFSASRAALKDWEHTILIRRGDFAFQFYQNIYNFWFEVQVLQNKISAPGYLEAQARGNDLVVQAYHNARFVGANVPHIDPLKEVKAERAKLGQAHLPLTTAEAATESLGEGEYDSNVEQVIKEVKAAEDLEPTSSTEEEPPEPPEVE